MGTRPAWTALLFPLLLPTACVGYAVPAAHVTNARDVIGVAHASGAATSARARPYLLIAESEFQRAMVSTGKEADLLLLRSQVDAELAIAVTREDRLEGQAIDASERARSLSEAPPGP